MGSEVKATLKKSRFGTQGRQCTFKILWGDEIGVQDEESWFEAIKSSKHMSSSGAWYTLDMGNGESVKFQPSKWKENIQEEAFKARILELMDEEIILKFDKREGKATEFYDIEEDGGNE